MSYGIKISKPGFDTLTAADKDLIFTSDRSCLKEKLAGLIDTNASGDVTINHALGYVPSFLIFIADSTALGVWYPWDSADVSADTNNIYIVGAMGGVQSKVYYQIFVDQL